jgi:hypothetical protein
MLLIGSFLAVFFGVWRALLAIPIMLLVSILLVSILPRCWGPVVLWGSCLPRCWGGRRCAAKAGCQLELARRGRLPRWHHRGGTGWCCPWVWDEARDRPLGRHMASACTLLVIGSCALVATPASSAASLIVVVRCRRRSLLLGRQEQILLLHLCHLLLEVLVMCGQVGQLAVEVGVRGGEVGDCRLS